MSILYRALEKLLPKGEAFKLTVDKILTKYVSGLASGVLADFKDFAFSPWQELLPPTTTSSEQWANQFGLFPIDAEDNRRAAIAAAWSATGGQGLAYLQSVIDAAGFNVTVHASLDPDTMIYRNPLDYLPDAPEIGQIHCDGARAYCGDPLAYSSGLQGNIQDHIVNQNLSGRAQPKISSDAATHPFWIYVGGEVFGDYAVIQEERSLEFQSLILSIFPGTYWIGYFITTESLNLITEGGDQRITEGGNARITE